MSATEQDRSTRWLNRFGVDTRPEPYGDISASAEERAERIAKRLRDICERYRRAAENEAGR